MIKKHTTIGIDVGGTKIYAARFDIHGNIEVEIQVVTPSRGNGKKMITTLIDVIEKIFPIEKNTVEKIGIGWPGIIDPKTGIVKQTPHIFRVKNIDIAQALEKKFEIPVRIDNDANCFAFAETTMRNKKNMVGLIIGTGLGGGIIQDGKIITGKNGEEGEFAPLLWKNGKNFQEILAGKTFYFFKKTATEKWQNALVDLLEMISIKYAPEIIVFGGGVAVNILRVTKCDELVLEKIQKNLEKKLRKKGIESIPVLKISTLKNAGALGASML